MKWTVDNINHEAFQVLGLQSEEIKMLQSFLPKELDKIRKKLEKYRDIHESGEATSRQQTILFELECKYAFITDFINIKP